MRAPLHYTSCRLDRAAHRRNDQPWLDDARRNGAFRVLALWQDRNLVAPGDRPSPLPLEGEAARTVLARATETVFLGTGGDGEAWFACDLPGDEEPAVVDGASFADLRRVGPLLDPDVGSLLAYARAILFWHRQHRFCGACGAETRGLSGGHMRECANGGCGLKQFPRTDPVVIMLVTRRGAPSDACLLGRQAAWPRGLVSTLAGFVEPGESLETAVRREVLEEVGLTVDHIRYRASQPWPFPSSLMLGFRADAIGETGIRFDPAELEDARWFTREEVGGFGRGQPFKIPYGGTIARALIEEWLEEGRCGG